VFITADFVASKLFYLQGSQASQELNDGFQHGCNLKHSKGP